MVKAAQQEKGARVQALLKRKKWRIRLALLVCAHCGMCAESCFLYRQKGRDPKYMPSYKVINSIGVLQKERGSVSGETLQEIKKNLWERCALCMRCYCPLGLNNPEMLALGRSACRLLGASPDYEKEPGQ
jgi:Fe-S oxidoreductase